MKKVNKQKMLANWTSRPPCERLVGARQGGFTLIEIAIVLVIIGLLLGGVLKGQELINTARVRALNNNVDGITAAWFGFQDRYRAFPGDYGQAIVNLPDIPAVNIQDGDGNGLVGLTGTVDSPAERANVWLHLQAAGYITGAFDGVTTAIPADKYNCAISTCPDNGFGQGMLVSRGALQQSSSSQAHELLSGQSIPSEVLAELDRKIDDGTPSAGAMQLGKEGDGWGSVAEIRACQGADVNAYNMKSPSDNCAAVFRNF
jgi:prepilin-type N-terminal cleavage/methylation domain-containing protein